MKKTLALLVAGAMALAMSGCESVPGAAAGVKDAAAAVKADGAKKVEAAKVDATKTVDAAKADAAKKVDAAKADAAKKTDAAAKDATKALDNLKK